jgi:hypothetical protein
LVGVLQLWRHALAAVAEGVLAGFAGVTGRCTPMGRASMSLDLQQVTAGASVISATHADMAVQLRALSLFVYLYLGCMLMLSRSS